MSKNVPAVSAGSRSLQSLSPLQLYMKEIANYPLLDPEEEHELAVKHYEDGDLSAAHRLVTANLRLVIKIAGEFSKARSNLLDLIQEGNFGLMQAVKRFDPYRGVKLSTYSAWWIKAYILKYLMDNKSQVKMGTTAAQRKLFYNLRKETEKLLALYDRADTKLLADSLDVKESEVVEMQTRLENPDVSLDAPVDEAGTTTRGGLIADPAKGADDLLASAELRKVFGDHLEDFEKTLKERDHEIFKLRMLAEEPLTLQEIGDRYGISRERARQLEAKILRKLRAFVEDQGIIDV